MIPINLDAKTEDPTKRTGFAHSLPAVGSSRTRSTGVGSLHPHRGVDRPRPPHPGGRHRDRGGYGPWRRVLGGILTLHEIPGFLGNLTAERTKSPDTDTFEAICQMALKVETYDGEKKYGEGATSSRPHRRPLDRWVALVRFTLWTGLRAAEVAGLKVNRLDPLRNQVHVVETAQWKDSVWIIEPPKSKLSRRTVPVPPSSCARSWTSLPLASFRPQITCSEESSRTSTLRSTSDRGDEQRRQPGSRVSASTTYGTRSPP
jgi:integrase